MSNIYKSAAQWFNAANGKRVIKTVSGVLTLEEWPEWVADAKAQLIAQGATPIETDNGLSVKENGQFWMKPRLRASESGTLAVRSADYAFIPEGQSRGVYGDKKGAKVQGASLVKTYDNGMIVTFTMESE